MRTESTKLPTKLPANLPRATDMLGGWRLVAVISGIIGASALLFAAAGQFEAGGLRMAVRFTARTSFTLFILAFSASSLRRLWPGQWTQWLLRNRRYIGLSFAASHAMHAIAIIAFATTAPAEFHEATSPATFIFGGIGYALIMAMAATSFDRSAAAIGQRAWKLLHTTGIFYLWAQFSVSLVKHYDGTPIYWLFFAMLVAAMALRIMARLRPRAGLAQAR